MLKSADLAARFRRALMTAQQDSEMPTVAIFDIDGTLVDVSLSDTVR
jgi:hypothetical protein